jgi:hypothetical protein
MNKQLKLNANITFKNWDKRNAGKIMFINENDENIVVALEGELTGHDSYATDADVVTVSADFVRAARKEMLWNVAFDEVLTINGKPFVLNPAPEAKITLSPKAKNTLSPQCASLLTLLQSKGSTTALEAAGVYRIRALPRRIADLKAAGYKISSVISNDVTGQRYARYYLNETPAVQVAA